MNKTKSALVIFCALFLTCRPLQAEEAGEIIIILDQSISMKYYDPEQTSKTRLKSFIAALDVPFRVTLTGFDEDVHELISVVADEKKAIDTLAETIDAIDFSGLATDLEMPFRYLLERSDHERIKMVLLITDGEPEIWDRNLKYLSRRVLSDPKYQDLNERYSVLEKTGSHEKLYEELGRLYHARNIELIENHLPELVETLFEKITLWDVSGHSRYLKSLAGLTGTQFLPFPPTASEEALKDLNKALSKTYLEGQIAAKTAAVVKKKMAVAAKAEAKAAAAQAAAANEAENARLAVAAKAAQEEPEKEGMPEDAKEAVADLPSATAKIISREKEEEAQQVIAEKIETDKETSEGTQQDGATFIIVLIMLALGATIFWLLFIRRRSVKETVGLLAEAEGARQEVSPGSSDNGAVETIDDLSKERLGDFEVKKLQPEQALENRGDEAEEAINIVSEETPAPPVETSPTGQERRFSLRVDVPPGVMLVYWSTLNGVQHEGEAINISMHGILFKSPGFNGGSIDRIACPRLNFDMRVTRATPVRDKHGDMAAVIDEFEDDTNSRMRWVELLTRINEEE